MLAYLKQIPEINPIIIDNGSTYEPLLQFYSEKPCEIDFVGRNSGENVMFVTDRIDTYNLAEGNYIITDPDLDLASVPLDFLDVLREGLVKYQWADKCGLGIRIDDLPESPLKSTIVAHEQGHWREPLDFPYWKAATDTTFSLFRGKRQSFDCVRTGGDYQMRHLDWYVSEYSQISDEYKFYLQRIGNEHSHWSKEIKRRAGL